MSEQMRQLLADEETEYYEETIMSQDIFSRQIERLNERYTYLREMVRQGRMTPEEAYEIEHLDADKYADAS